MEYKDTTINLSLVAKDKNSLSVTRLLARQLMENPYTTVGDFLRGISDSDLQTLIHGLEDGDKLYADYILISMMLAQAEGVQSPEDDDGFAEQVDRLVMMLSVESLARKGLVRIYHDNLSFGADMDDKIVCEKIDGIYYQKYLDGDIE